MMVRRTMLLAAVLLCGAVPAAACGGQGSSSPSPSAAARVVKIAVQAPLTGGRVASRDVLPNGAELAVRQLSGPLEKAGYTVKLVTFDDQADPVAGAANAEKIVADPRFLGVVGHGSSSVQLAAQEVYHAAGLANVTPAATSPDVTGQGYPEVSRVVGRDDVQGAVAARFAAGRGAGTAYVVYNDEVYGTGIAKAFRRAAKKLGVQVTGVDAVSEGAYMPDVGARAAAAGADVLYFGGYYDQGAPLFKAAREAGFTGMCLSDDGFNWSAAAEMAGEALLEGDGTFYTTVAAPASAYPGSERFRADYAEAFGAQPAQFAAQAYDATAVLLKAIEVAAAEADGAVPTRAAVAAKVRALTDFPGITGVFSFDASGDLATAPYFVFRVTTADPQDWAGNRLVEIVTLPPAGVE